MTLIEACNDPHLFARWFRDRSTWSAWFVFMAALFGLPLSAAQLEIYRRHTGRTDAPTVPATEGWLICGRRAGKSFALALIAVFLACFRSYAAFLGPGERATIMVVAADRKQARQIYRYIRGIMTGTPLLSAMIIGDPRSDGLDLNNSVTIEVGTASFRTTRGYTFAAVLCDELAFWPTDEAAEPDHEVLDAVRPGLATLPGSMLLCASSPYSKRGALYDAFRRHFGRDGDPVLVWKATSRAMNASLSQDLIDRAMERDAAQASAEWLAEFRADIEAFVSREAVEACVARGERERPPVAGVNYRAFCDPSGGSHDSMTLAIGHSRDGAVVVDALREIVAPFNPEDAVLELVRLMQSYNINEVVSDRYAGAWVSQSFEKRGIRLMHSELNKSQLYIDLLPKLNARTISLLDHARCVAQVCALERRTARGGRDSIDHPPGGRDDVANAVAGLASIVTAPRNTWKAEPIPFLEPPPEDPKTKWERWHRERDYAR